LPLHITSSTSTPAPPSAPPSPLPLHDALPICTPSRSIDSSAVRAAIATPARPFSSEASPMMDHSSPTRPARRSPGANGPSWERRSEEHTSELQSRFDLVCRLLLAKNKDNVTQR